MTEQGEVVAERYGDPLIAHRHLEQLTWATMLVSAEMEPPPDPQWIAPLGAGGRGEAIGPIGGWWRIRTFPPISIAPRRSRPSSRCPSVRGPAAATAGRRSTSFAPFPTRSLGRRAGTCSPAIYGLGSGLAASTPADWQAWTEMYRGWPFFRALIDNAELALAKADPGIVRHYASMVADPVASRRILEQIENEYRAHAAGDPADQAAGRTAGDRALAEAVGGLRNPRVDLLEFRAGGTLATTAAAGRSAGRRWRDPCRDLAVQRPRHFDRRTDDGVRNWVLDFNSRISIHGPSNLVLISHA